MDWQNVVELLLQLGISTTFVAAVLGYLGKKVIEQYLKSKLETHKSKLSNEAAQFKLNLEKLNSENSIRYHKIFEERAVLIKDFYALIDKLERQLENLTSCIQGPEWVEDKERDENAKKSLEKTKRKFSKNRVFFTKKQCENIDNLIDASQQIIRNMTKAKWQSLRESRDPNLLINNAQLGKTATDNWIRCEQDVVDLFMPTKKELEDDFRKLFGIEDNLLDS